MSSPGLSLVGFMDQAAALNHLRTACIPADPSDAALIAIWNAAKTKLGAAFSDAGRPDIQLIPASEQPYINQLNQQAWAATALSLMQSTYSFQLIEIDKLLAFQLTANNIRIDQHCGHLKYPVGTSAILPVCLPLSQPAEEYIAPPSTPNATSTIIKTKNTSMRRMGAGIFTLNMNGLNTSIAGMQFHTSLPFVHVVRFNGRCYLHNGFHRAVGVRKAGATHVPCVFRDVSSADEVGIQTDGGTFPLQLMESADAPTVGHFTQGRAWDVSLRNLSRILQVSWADYVLPDEY